MTDDQDAEQPGFAPKAFLGRWRIVDLMGWDDEEDTDGGPSNLTLKADFEGSFSMGAVRGDIDATYDHDDGEPLMEFCWQGFDEFGTASGRGWAVLVGPARLVGEVYIFKGGRAEFAAEREH
jgi:hypothetical protein